MWQIGTGDFQHIGAVFRQRARTGRSRNDARQVQRAHAGKRTRPVRQRLRRSITDLNNLDHGQIADRGSVRMRRPFRVRARESATGTIFM